MILLLNEVWIFLSTQDFIWYIGQICVFIFLVVYTILMLQSARKSAIESQKEMFQGFSGFMFANLLNQMIFLIHTYYRRLGRTILPRVIGIGGTGYEYLMLCFFSLAFIFIMKPIEKYLLNKEKLRITQLNKITFVLITIPYICALLYLSTFENIMEYNASPYRDYFTLAAYPGMVFFGFSALFSMFGSFIFYFRLGFQGTGLIRKKGFMLGFGILFLYCGILIGPLLGGYLGVVLGPGIMLVGGILVLSGHRITL